MSTYKDLMEQRRELEQRIELARKAEVAAVVADIRQKIADYNLSPEDIFRTGAAKSASKNIVPPKYRGINGETWTGRGRTPGWLTAAMAEGYSLTDFLIAKESDQAKQAA